MPQMGKVIASVLIFLIAQTTAAWGLDRRILSPNYRPTSKKVKVAVFDADSTLRVAPSGNVSANHERDFFLLPFVTEKIAELVRQGYLVVIASNQAGVGRHVTLEQADAALFRLRKLVHHFNPAAEIHYHDFAEKNDGDRKPQTGMIDRLEQILRDEFEDEFPGIAIDRKRSFVCGDAAYKKAKKGEPGQTRPDGSPGTDVSDSDRMLAHNAGMAFIDPADFFEWVKRGGPVRFHSKPEVDAFFEAHPEWYKAGQSCPRELGSDIPDRVKRKTRPKKSP